MWRQLCKTRWKAMCWLSQREPIRGVNWVDTLTWVSLSCVTAQSAIGPEARWCVEERRPLLSSRLALFEDHRRVNRLALSYQTISPVVCDASLSFQWRLSLHRCSFIHSFIPSLFFITMLSFWWCKWGRRLSSMKHHRSAPQNQGQFVAGFWNCENCNSSVKRKQ